jgi:hypothetical protein
VRIGVRDVVESSRWTLGWNQHTGSDDATQTDRLTNLTNFICAEFQELNPFEGFSKIKKWWGKPSRPDATPPEHQDYTASPTVKNKKEYVS